MERLATVDPSDGRRLQQFCLDPFSIPVVNRHTDRLILASPGGIITSLVSRRQQSNNETEGNTATNGENPQEQQP